jgi:hypothetical protein
MMISPRPTKQRIRFWTFLLLSLIAYVVCIITLFGTKSFILPLISFIILFISLYFFAIEVYQYPKKPFFFLLTILIIVEILCFALGKTRHFYLEILLINFTIGVLLYQLFFHLKTRITFSPFSYFTESGYIIAVMVTLLVSVLLIGRYSQIPFTCDDINGFLPKLLSFSQSKTPTKEIITTAEKSEVELFFENIKHTITTQALELQGSMNQNSCEFVMAHLKKTQINQGFQIAVLLLLYFLLIGLFKIILRIINFVSFFLFLLLKPFKVYQYKKSRIEKEWIE